MKKIGLIIMILICISLLLINVLLYTLINNSESYDLNVEDRYYSADYNYNGDNKVTIEVVKQEKIDSKVLKTFKVTNNTDVPLVGIGIHYEEPGSLYNVEGHSCEISIRPGKSKLVSFKGLNYMSNLKITYYECDFLY
ncbi:hypothetical protein [Terrisporobacter hibernicus]|uniref:Uncharacterized protein n=1 Tax=Terrisporobacter hibernicus TaxID=2813371 RepID=A0AAX2ZKL5_9FIRM|nr:hypothetical protein [Terrisporobacter hibernicus]UEL48202.1 hypothetical protein JW646_01760 [Terrisporobacter hibernicus]